MAVVSKNKSATTGADKRLADPVVIGVLKETKPQEERVALLPQDVMVLLTSDHSGRVEVWVEFGAGARSGFEDDEYVKHGASLTTAGEILHQADIVVGVKELQAGQLDGRPRGQFDLRFHHPANYRMETLTRMMELGLVGVSFDLPICYDGRTPEVRILSEMSRIAGELAVVDGTEVALASQGITDTRLNVLVFGAGVVGASAVEKALRLGHSVTLVDLLCSAKKVESFKGSVSVIFSDEGPREVLLEALRKADVVIGAAAVSGHRAPLVLSADEVMQMKQGSVVVDVAIDQGGCIETTREHGPTTRQDPSFSLGGIVHMAVPNMPARSAQEASGRISVHLQPLLLDLSRFLLNSDSIDRMGELKIAPAIFVTGAGVTNEVIAREFSVVHSPLAR